MAKIKLCGLFRNADIEAVNAAKPDYAGFIINFPKSHRNLDILKARELREKLIPEIKSVGVFVNRPAAEVISAAKTIGLDVIQLHGDEDDAYIDEIKAASGLAVWKAFKIRSKEDVRTACESRADMILLDNGYGTGEVFDWSVVTKLRRPFILAGGLNPENLKNAINTLHPDIVDVSSGAETEKLKDREKIAACVKAVRETAEDTDE